MPGHKPTARPLFIITKLQNANIKSIKADITGTNNQIKETATNAEISALYSRKHKQAGNVDTNRYSIVKSKIKGNE